MDQAHFDSGIRHLEVMMGTDLKTERKSLYFQHLQPIPNDLWTPAITRLAETAKFFPSAAEIGEACVPGDAEREEKDPWTERWKKVSLPWPERLTRLLTPALPAPEKKQPDARPQQGVTKEHWQHLRDMLSIIARHPGSARDIQSTTSPAEMATVQAQLHDKDSQEYETLSLEEKVRWQMRKRGGPRPLQQAWTREEMEERRKFLDRQFLWIKRREQAERLGEPFSEPQPVWEEQPAEQPQVAIS